MLLTQHEARVKQHPSFLSKSCLVANCKLFRFQFDRLYPFISRFIRIYQLLHA